jgi:TonB dependent receptor
MTRLLGLAFLVSAYAADAQVTPAASPEVTISAPRGGTNGGIDPIVALSPSELDAYGANSLSDLVDALRPLTRSSRSDQAAVVLINGHLAGPLELETLPREAIERVEVLPESVALKYGFSETRRVLNFVLREHYTGVPTHLVQSGATEGGDETTSADGALAHLNEEARLTALASFKDNAWLRDSDRDIDVPDGSYYTLTPNTTDTKVAASASRSILGVTSSLQASYGDQSIRSLQGLAVATAQAGAQLEQPLNEDTSVRTSRVALQFTGVLHDFIWGTTVSYIHIASDGNSDLGFSSAEQMLVDHTESSSNLGNLQLSLSGPVASMPAGPVIANFKLGFVYQGFETLDAQPAAALTASDLVRTVRSINANARLPIANRDRGVLSALGQLSGSFSTTLDSVSGFGNLLSSSWGLDWQPTGKLHLDAIYTDHRTAPTAEQLLAPPTYTPNVQTFDYITQQTVYVTEITGGNDALDSTDSRQGSYGISIGPFAGKSEFLAHYEQSSIVNAIGALPPTTAAVESAFGDRFIRSANGTLTEIDDRWVNLQHEQVDDIKWGFDVWVPIGTAPAQGKGADRVEVSIFDTWYLHAVTLIRPGIPELDLLNGAPSDLSGGQPRHKVELHALWHRGALGVLLDGEWRSATLVGSGDATTPDDLYFSSLFVLSPRVFVDLGRMVQNSSWAKNARVTLYADNLFDRRQSVRDAEGVTPLAFEPGFLDPQGRVVGLSLRKVF